MSNQGFRPRYKFHSPLSAAELQHSIVKAAKENNPNQIIVRKVRDHLVLDIANDHRHFWSPHMDINLEFDPEVKATLVRCLIGPVPTVWTLFMFFYGFFGFMAFVGLTLGMSQWTLKKPMWGLWLLPVSAAGVGLMYYISYKGKQLSQDEMFQLKSFVDDALGCDCLSLSDEQAAASNNLSST